MRALNIGRKEKYEELNNLLFLYILIVIVVTLPFLLTNKFFFLVNRISILLLFINWIISRGLTRRIKISAAELPVLLFISFYILNLLSLSYTSNLADGYFALEKQIPFILCPLILGTTQSLNNDGLKKILSCFLLSVLAASVICVVYAFHRNNYFETFSNPNWFYFSYGDLTEIINIQPNYLAIYISFCFFIVVSLLIDKWIHLSILKKALLLSILFHFIVFLFLLACRTPILATFCMVFIGITKYFWSQKRLTKGLLYILLILLTLAFFSYSMPIVRERFLESFGSKRTSDWVYGDGSNTMPYARILKWQCSWKIIHEHWLIGVGIGDVQDELQKQYKATGFELAFQERFNSHNQFLQIWLGIGLIGLIIFLFGIWLALKKAFRTTDNLYLAFIACFMICSITESTLERQFGILFFALFNGLFYFHSKKQHS